MKARCQQLRRGPLWKGLTEEEGLKVQVSGLRAMLGQLEEEWVDQRCEINQLQQRLLGGSPCVGAELAGHLVLLQELVVTLSRQLFSLKIAHLLEMGSCFKRVARE